MRLILVLLILGVGITSAYATERMKLQVRGLQGELLTNVEDRLDEAFTDKMIADTPQFRRKATTEITKGLRALGYYSPYIQFSMEKGIFHTLIIARVDAGDPVLIERVNINIEGAGLKDPAFAHLLRDDTPNVGDVLNHGVYTNFKRHLQNLALNRGYFDFNLKESKLAVADKLKEAFWIIDFETGDRYKLGKVIFNKSEIREDYLRKIIPFKKGDDYNAADISTFSSRLSATNWFNGVTVLPNIHKAGKNKEIPLYVSTVPRKKNLYDLGLGYSTDIGTHGRFGWTKPRINSRGHSWYNDLSLSKVEQTALTSYKIPLAKSPLQQYYTLQSGYKHENNNDTYLHSYSFAVLRNWDSFTNWQKALGINASYNRFTQANNRYNTFLFYPSGNLYRVRQRGGLLPMWGDSQRYAVEIADRHVGSDISLFRFTMQQTWIRSLWNQHRFIVRGSFGIIESSSFKRVPPSFRYFAGGDRSIRGYNYQSISPRDTDDKLLGASRLLTGSFEYQYRLADKWWSAAFVDSGEAVDNFKHSDFYTGAGVGIRWVSPIGPVKIDIARPVSHQKKKRTLHLYLGIGAEL